MSVNLVIILCTLLAVIVSYLLGSVNFAIIITKAVTGKDIRDSGSGNAGMTNVMRSVGFWPGLTVFVCDFGKAALSVLIGRFGIIWLVEQFVPVLVASDVYSFIVVPYYGAFLCGFVCFLGHIFPVFFRFKGGKGVVAIIGALTVFNWRAAIMLFSVFLIIFLISKIVSLSSVISAVIYPVIVYIACTLFPVSDFVNAVFVEYGPIPITVRWFEAICAAFFSVVVIIKHKDNIKRIIRGEEKKLVLKKQK